MARGEDGSTRTDGVYAAIRGDILRGRLVPGERLKLPQLCEHYGTSVGSAREVLIRLVGEGLVRSQAHQGYVVTPLSYEDLTDLTDARVEVESLVLGLSVEAATVEWESRVVATHHVLERTPLTAEHDPGHPSDGWSAAHAEFHLALLEACPNRRLSATARALREEAELYRQWSVALGREPERDLPAEHRALRDAALAHDAELARRLLREHIAHTANLLLSCAVDERVQAGARPPAPARPTCSPASTPPPR